MVEHALREGTSGSGGSEGLSETEGLGDGKVSLDHHEWGALNGLFGDDDTAALGHALVDTTYGIIWSLDFDQEDGFLEAGGGSKLASVEGASGSGDNLTTSSVNSISVEGDILNVESDAAHVLVGHDALFGGPLEGGFHRVSDFVKILDLLGHVDQKVGAGGVWAEAPDLLGVIWIPAVVVSKEAVSILWVLLGGNLFILNVVGEIVSNRAGLGEDSVVLVG
jgi:hypothetical protein